MLLRCNNCGKTFSARRSRRTCSYVCARSRQNEATRQMKAKEGEIYLEWKEAMNRGVEKRVARHKFAMEELRRKKKGVI